MADQGTPRPPVTSEVTFKEGLIIVAALLGVMVGVVALRYAFIACIDMCILGDAPWSLSRRRRQTLAEEAAIGEQEQQEGVTSGVNNLLSGLTFEERSAVMESILSYKTVTSEDLVEWRGAQLGSAEEINKSGDQKASTEHTESTCSLGDAGDTVCSICLHEIEIGNVAATPRSCGHVFHRKCILEWLDRNSACPYCRSKMITENAVKDALARMP